MRNNNPAYSFRTFLLNTLCTLALICVTALPLSGQAYFDKGTGGAHAGNPNNGGVNQSRDNGTRAPANTGNGSRNSTGAENSNNNSRAAGGASDRSSVSGYSGGSGSSGGSRAEGNAADRNSVSGYSGGGGNNNNNNNSRAAGNASDRNSVSGYAGGSGNQSPIDKIGAGLKAGIETAKTMTRTAINNVVNTARTIVGIATGKQFTSLPSITQTPGAKPTTQTPTTQTPTAKPAEVPDQIKEQLAKMRGTTDVSPEEAREYEQMDLDAAKRGFQKELTERAAGEYKPSTDGRDPDKEVSGPGSTRGGDENPEAASPYNPNERFNDLTPEEARMSGNPTGAPAPRGEIVITRQQVAYTLPDIKWQLGPNRPNIPSGTVVDKLRDLVGELYGNEYTIVGTSGEEDEGNQHGSNRHQTGEAMDFTLEKDGVSVPYKGNEEVYEKIAVGMAGKYNASVGLGHNYMGGTHMHVDTVSPEKLGAGQDQEWGSTGNKMATQLQKARETGEYPGKTDPTQNGKLVATNVRDNGDVQIAGNGVRQKPEAPTSGITSLLQKAVQLKDAVTQKAVEKKDALVATVKEKAPAVAAGIEKFNSLPGWMKELAKKMFSEGGNGTAPKGNDGNRESEKNGNNQNASSTLGN